MKDLFHDRLKKVDDLAERKWMKEIIDGVFLKLTEYTEAELEKLEQRVYSEVEDRDEKFSTYTDLLSLDDYDPLEEILYPMNPDDLERVDLTEVREAMKQQEKPILSKIYLPLDYLKIKQKMDKWKNKEFTGELKTNLNTYPITAKVVPYRGYSDQIEELYHLYVKNDIPWKTVLHPYAAKFVQLQLYDYPELAEKEQLEKFSFQLEELEGYGDKVQIPCWNIQKIDINIPGFSTPAEDGIHFEHVINLDQYGREHGYLLDSDADHIIHTSRTDAEFSIISSKAKVINWPLTKVIHLTDQDRDADILGNHRREMFTDRFARKENRTIRSMCEVSRIINTYSAAKELKLEQVKMLEPGEEREETYPMNSFIKDTIRVEEEKKVMQLYFQTSDFTEITRDKMSFLASELQLHFPEYKCVGALL